MAILQRGAAGLRRGSDFSSPSGAHSPRPVTLPSHPLAALCASGTGDTLLRHRFFSLFCTITRNPIPCQSASPTGFLLLRFLQALVPTLQTLSVAGFIDQVTAAGMSGVHNRGLLFFILIIHQISQNFIIKTQKDM